jgi:hypothetical protein
MTRFLRFSQNVWCVCAPQFALATARGVLRPHLAGKGRPKVDASDAIFLKAFEAHFVNKLSTLFRFSHSAVDYLRGESAPPLKSRSFSSGLLEFEFGLRSRRHGPCDGHRDHAYVY